MNVQRPERKDLLCWGEIYNYRDVSAINGKMYNVFRTKSRRLTKGEENALALIGLRMASEKRQWVAGEPHEVSVGSVMSKVFNNPRLMARTVFQSWFKRQGIKLVKHSTATRGVWVQVPNDIPDRHPAFGDPGGGTCWQILVKPEVLYEAMKMHIRDGWQNMPNVPMHKDPTEGDAVTGRHSILGSPEGHQDSETGDGTMAPSGCLQAATPAQSPHNAQDEGVAMEPPLIFRPDEWQEEATRAFNERADNYRMAIRSPWMNPSDPDTVVEDLNKIDNLLDEAEQMSQVGYGEHDEESDLDIQVAAPEAQVAAPEAQQIRRIDVPPEVRGWDDDD